MNSASIRTYCLQKKGSAEDLPFGDEVLAIKVAGKMFALIKIREGTTTVNLKCDPALALELRRKYPSVKPGYHMNKQHWNTVEIDGTVPEEEVFKMIDHSYDLVVRGLKRSERDWIKSQSKSPQT
ncbi:MAG: MmcQ/YjbR family DNA-binding protein [Dehalococcoidia bacterium]|nr:MmcQ/YjbR family DNA-binding protein [Dehalococcoidia bacterium]